MRTYKTEFPELGELPEAAILAGMGFSDQSWHNDTCPNFVHESMMIRVWVEAAEIQNREDEFYPRYCVELGIFDGSETHNENPQAYAGESWDETCIVIRESLAIVRALILVSSELQSNGLEALTNEQKECLLDPARYSEALDMIDDLECRCSISGYARGEIASALTDRQARIEDIA